MEANQERGGQDFPARSPYAPPSDLQDPVEQGRDMLRLPAIVFLIVCILGIAFDAVLVFSSIYALAGVVEGEAVQGARKVSIGIGLARGGFFLLAHLVILNAACDIVARKNYSRSTAVCKFAFVPYVTPLILLGIPLAVWVFLTLRDDRVRKAFEPPLDED